MAANIFLGGGSIPLLLIKMFNNFFMLYSTLNSAKLFLMSIEIKSTTSSICTLKIFNVLSIMYTVLKPW